MLLNSFKPLKRALQGAILAFGAPSGWLTIRYIGGVEPISELGTHSGLYLYMLIGTIAAFSSFGWYVGNKEEDQSILAIRDSLTGLFNVRYFQERLLEEVHAAQRFDTTLTLILFDIDHFKHVNDTYGHAVGDEILILITQAAAKVLRKHEVLARVGGEEFVALLPRSNRENGRITAERIREQIANTALKIANNNNLSVTISLGVSELDENDDEKTLYENTDRALYLAKNNGRNRTELV